MYENILEKARELGELIAQSEAFVTLQEKEEQTSANAEVSDLYAQYADLSDQLQAAAMEEEPDADLVRQLSRDREAVATKLNQHPGMQETAQARDNFNLLMDSVNRELQLALDPDSAFEPEGCGSAGGCAGCSGCGPER